MRFIFQLNLIGSNPFRKRDLS